VRSWKHRSRDFDVHNPYVCIMYVGIYVSIVCACVCMYVLKYVLCTYVCMYVCMYLCKYCVCVRAYVCMNVCIMYVCVYACVHAPATGSAIYRATLQISAPLADIVLGNPRCSRCPARSQLVPVLSTGK
jgi:hypothetical protein